MLKKIIIIGLLLFSGQSFSQTTALLESPLDGSIESGVSIIRGWVCDAEKVTIHIDDLPPLEAAYGTTRTDTMEACGDANNAFGFTINWNLLPIGQHTLSVLADGIEFGKATFTVTTLGTTFLTGVSGEFSLAGFPDEANTTQISWSQANQNFVLGIANNDTLSSGDSTHKLESPQTGSAESGLALIRGWVCEAQSITIQIDNFDPLEAAYGTSREDTMTACGDSNNGFGLVINWNLVGDGTHTLKALADGAEFASIDFTVTTLGSNFLTGAKGDFLFPDFPSANRNTSIRWSEPHQNFIIVGDSANNDKDLLGLWEIQTLNGDPLPFPITFVNAEFTENEFTVTMNLDCTVTVAYVTIADDLSGIITQTKGLFCPPGFGNQGIGKYAINDNTLTVNGVNEAGEAIVSIFTKVIE